MSRSNVTLAKSVNVSKLKFSEPKSLTNGSRTVYINYEGAKLQIQTPIQSVPYGFMDWSEQNNAGKKADEVVQTTKKYDMHLSFRDYDTNPKMKALYDKMLEIEKRVIDEAFEKRESWLQDDYEGSLHLVKKLFVPIVKYDIDKKTKKIVGKYPPTMKVKLPYDSKNDVFAFECHDMEGEPLDFKTIVDVIKGAKARLIIELSGIWFAGGKYGCTWKVINGMFQTTSKREIPQFLPDSDDDLDDENVDQDHQDDNDLAEDAEEALKSLVKPMAKVELDPDAEEDDEEQEQPQMADTKEEEDEDSEIDEPPPPPKKSAAKKTTKK
jgi:hypothetical protein